MGSLVRKSGVGKKIFVVPTETAEPEGFCVFAEIDALGDCVFVGLVRLLSDVVGSENTAAAWLKPGSRDWRE
jgi:hypothetical protein